MRGGKVKDDFRAVKIKVRIIENKKAKKHGEKEIHSYMMAGMGSKPNNA